MGFMSLLSMFSIIKNQRAILKSIDKRDINLFLSIINNKNNNLSIYANKANKTFINMKSYILNSLKYEYSNGIVEGTNNLIKQIKHAACGYTFKG